MTPPPPPPPGMKGLTDRFSNYFPCCDARFLRRGDGRSRVDELEKRVTSFSSLILLAVIFLIYIVRVACVRRLDKFLEIILFHRGKNDGNFLSVGRRKILRINRDAGFNQCGSHYQISMLPLCLSSFRSFSAVIASRRDEIRFPLLPKPAST